MGLYRSRLTGESSDSLMITTGVDRGSLAVSRWQLAAEVATLVQVVEALLPIFDEPQCVRDVGVL